MMMNKCYWNLVARVTLHAFIITYLTAHTMNYERQPVDHSNNSDVGDFEYDIQTPQLNYHDVISAFWKPQLQSSTTRQLFIVDLLLLIINLKSMVRKIGSKCLWITIICAATFLWDPVQPGKGKKRVKSKFAKTTFKYKPVDISVVIHMGKVLKKLRRERKALLYRTMQMLAKCTNKIAKAQKTTDETWKSIKKTRNNIIYAQKSIKALPPALEQLKNLLDVKREVNNMQIRSYATIFVHATQITTDQSPTLAKIYIRERKRHFSHDVEHYHKTFRVLEDRYEDYATSPDVKDYLKKDDFYAVIGENDNLVRFDEL